MRVGTRFREYPRGRTPEDFAPQWASFAAPVRSIEMDAGRESWITIPGDPPGPNALAWKALDEATGHGDQQGLPEFQCRNAGIAAPVLWLRAGGAAGAHSGYSFEVGGGFLTIRRWLGGAATTLGTVAFDLQSYQRARLRAEASGTFVTNEAVALRARAWLPDEEAEPATWLSVNDVNPSAPADGAIALGADGGAVDFFGLGIGFGGDSAVAPEEIPGGIDDWAMEPGAKVEFTLELETFNPISEVSERIFLSTRGRFTGLGDFPPNAEMPPLIADPGSVSERLVEDLLFGQADTPAQGATLRNPRRLLDYLLGRTLARRRATLRGGLAEWSQHRFFEPLYSMAIEGEPSIEDQIQIAYQSPFRMLEPNLKVRRHRGLSTGLKINAGTHGATHFDEYAMLAFLISFRFIASGAAAADRGITSSESLTNENYTLLLEASTGCVIGRASIGGISHGLYLRSPLGYADGVEHQAALGVSAAAAYLIVDGVVVARATPAGPVDRPAAAGISLFGFAGETIFDIRLLNFCPGETEAQAILNAAGRADTGTVGLWPCGDLDGPTATDYSGLANDIALTGTEGVDYAWVPINLGQPDQVSAVMPLALGNVQNAQAIRIDAGRSRYRLNDGPLPNQLVRLRGEVVDTWSDVGDGVIEFPTPVSEPVTFDVVPSALPGSTLDFARLPNVLENLFVNRMGLGEDGYDPYALDLLRRLMPFPVQLFTTEEMNGAAALEWLLGGTGGNYRLDVDGRLVAGTLLPPISPGPVAGEAALELCGLGEELSGIRFGDLGDVDSDQSHTVAAWIKPLRIDRAPDGEVFFVNHPPAQGIVEKESGSAGYFLGVSHLGSGQIVWSHPGALDIFDQGYLATPEGTLEWGRWTFVMAQYEVSPPNRYRRIFVGKKGGTLELVAEQEIASAAPTTAPGIPWQIGRGFCGAVQHAQAWGAALTLEEGRALMYAPPAGGEKDLLAYAPITEGFGNLARDRVSEARGRIRGGRWCPRFVFDFRRGLSGSRLRVRRPRPAWDCLVNHSRIYRPITDAEISAAVLESDPAEADRLRRPFRTADAPDTSILAKYWDARQVPLDSPLTLATDGSITARRQRDRLAPERLQGVMSEAPRAALALRQGDEIWVVHPAIQGSGAAAFRVIGRGPQFRQLRASLDLWGDALDPESAAILADDLGPLTDDEGNVIFS